MARHELDVYQGNQIYKIPAPAIDMTSGQARYGSSGSYLSGGGYVRRSPFGARNIGVSWNNLNTESTNKLLRLDAGGPFIWDNPMARANVVPPWLTNHGEAVDQKTYWLPSDVKPSSVNINTPNGYPNRALKYEGINTYADLFDFILPADHVATMWGVGILPFPGSIGVTTYTIALHQGSGTPSQTTIPSVPEPRRMVFTLHTRTSLDFTLQGIYIAIHHEDVPPPPAEYRPGLGSTEAEFTEEGLQLVQHSAALDMQSAAATWLETGWWK